MPARPPLPLARSRTLQRPAMRCPQQWRPGTWPKIGTGGGGLPGLVAPNDSANTNPDQKNKDGKREDAEDALTNGRLREGVG